MLKLAISGAAGRMGARLIALGSEDFEIVGAVEATNHPKLGQDAGVASGIQELGISFADTYPDAVEVVIDFSHPAGADAAISHCLDKKIPLVMATTGLEPESVERLKQASHEIPIVWAPSMSLAVNLTLKTTAPVVMSKSSRDIIVTKPIRPAERHLSLVRSSPTQWDKPFINMDVKE